VLHFVYEPTGHPLRRRTNVVVSSTLEPSEGILVARSLSEALNLVRPDETEGFVIGGQRLFAEAIHRADRMCLTFVDSFFPQADTFFPEYDRTEWALMTSDPHPATEGSGQSHGYIMRVFNRLRRKEL